MTLDELYKLRGQLETHVEAATEQLKQVKAQIYKHLNDAASKQPEIYKGPSMVKVDEQSSQSTN